MCPRSIQVDTTGRKQCVLFLEIVDFVDVDTVKRFAQSNPTCS